MTDDIFSQSPYRCKLDWGRVGARRAAERGDIVVIVDVLSFSTTVAHAVSNGAVVYPCREDIDASRLAAGLNAELAVCRNEVPERGKYSLSPFTFDNIVAGTRVVLPSLNGGTCARCSDMAAYVFAGALVNAAAVADAVSGIMEMSDLEVTVIACGEREKEPPHDLRMAIEDYLGAGAILAGLPFDKSPEARVCENAFTANSDYLGQLIWDCISGRELRAEGFGDDVTFAAGLDFMNSAPVLTSGAFCHYQPEQ